MTKPLIVRLKAHRTEAGLTQMALAQAIGVSRKTINTIENGVFTPSTRLALEMADYFDCSVHDLFELPDD